MPIYEYKCQDCCTEFEKLQKINDPKPRCPECNSTDTIKQVSKNHSFILKGSGWFKK